MARYEIGDDARLQALVDAAERGDEAVITRNGIVVAHVIPIRTAAANPRGATAASLDIKAVGNVPTSVPAALRDVDDH